MLKNDITAVKLDAFVFHDWLSPSSAIMDGQKSPKHNVGVFIYFFYFNVDAVILLLER